jgi:hypothetical protein
LGSKRRKLAAGGKTGGLGPDLGKGADKVVIVLKDLGGLGPWSSAWPLS